MVLLAFSRLEPEIFNIPQSRKSLIPQRIVPSPGQGGSVGWNVVPYTQRVVGLILSQGAWGRQLIDVSLTLMPLCLCLCLSLCLSLSLSLPFTLSLKEGGKKNCLLFLYNFQKTFKMKNFSEPRTEISFKYTTMSYCTVLIITQFFQECNYFVKWGKIVLFHLELYQELFIFSENHIFNSNVAYSIWVTTAELYQSAFVAITFLVFIHMNINLIVFLCNHAWAFTDWTKCFIMLFPPLYYI